MAVKAPTANRPAGTNPGAPRASREKAADEKVKSVSSGTRPARGKRTA